jgi:hypothetical protein
MNVIVFVGTLLNQCPDASTRVTKLTHIVRITVHVNDQPISTRAKQRHDPTLLLMEHSIPIAYLGYRFCLVLVTCHREIDPDARQRVSSIPVQPSSATSYAHITSHRLMEGSANTRCPAVGELEAKFQITMASYIWSPKVYFDILAVVEIYKIQRIASWERNPRGARC